MTSLERLIFVGGLLHFSLLSAGALVPWKLRFRTELQKVDPMLRELVWVYYVFIALCIVGFGCLSVMFSAELVSGIPIAKALCAFIGLFWGMRLAMALFVFHAKDKLSTLAFRVGYHALTVVFIYHAVVYSLVAIVT